MIRYSATVAAVLFAAVAFGQDPAPTIEQRVAELERKLAAAEQLAQDNDKKLGEMAEMMTNLQNELDQKDQELREVLNALSRRDSEGNPVLALSSIMQKSSEFKQELADAINGAIPNKGTLLVTNETTVDQVLDVNGKSYTIPARQVATFDVPVGTLTTQLVGQESPKNWTIAPPTYEESIVIRIPTPTVQVFETPPVVFLP